MARLQQILTLAAVALALLCFHEAWLAGQTVWAWVGLLAPLGLLAVVLLLEFLLLSWQHGADPAPRASWAQLTKAWWGELVCAIKVFCWRQPFFVSRWPDFLPAGAAVADGAEPGSRGVLLIHGYFCNRAFWNPWLERLQAQGTPFVALSLEPVFGTIDDYVPAVEQAMRRLEQATGKAPVVVAHSMGGLVFRRWWVEQPGVRGDQRVHHAITLGTPHQGTWLARFATTRNARQMRQGSPWLLDLAQRELTTAGHQRRYRMTCFFSHCDNIVFPPSTATLVGADNRHLQGLAHVQLVDSELPWQALQQHLVSPA